MDQSDQQFLKDLDARMWKAACKLLPSLDAAVYKHVVLGLVFLKYIADSFNIRRGELITQFKDPDHEYYLGDDANEESVIAEELEQRDYYTEQNVFWVPEQSRWDTLLKCAKLNPGVELPWGSKMISAGHLIDNAMDVIEQENSKLKGVLNKDYTRLQLESGKLAELMDLIGTVPFNHHNLNAKDILGHVYEYFLGEFASAEGKKGGQFYTPKSIVSLMVEMLEPFKGRVYDPAMGSGGFFVSSERFVEEHGGRIGDIHVYGQESNPTTWRLAAMNMVIRGIEFDFGSQPADTFGNNQHPDLRANYIMANPPFNIKEWASSNYLKDIRWKFGIPPKNNANYAWLQHMFYHLAPEGLAGVVLANGALSSNGKEEFEIRKKLIDQDAIECIVSLPTHLFTNTQIGASIWILRKGKKKRNKEVLFINAKECGALVSKVLRVFDDDEIKAISNTYRSWISSKYEDIPGYSASVSTEDIARHKYALVPGRYVGFYKEDKFSDERKQLIFKQLREIESRIEDVVESSLKTAKIVKGFING